MADKIDPDQATIGPTRFRFLVAAFVLGALVGYTLVPLSERLHGTAPTIQWTSAGVLAVIAVVLLVLAYSTYRTLHRERRRMEPHRAVNFLMMAKACALVGALLAGGYVGFGAQFVDQMDVVLPHQRVVRSLVAAGASLAIVFCALLLERACRVPSDPES